MLGKPWEANSVILTKYPVNLQYPELGVVGLLIIISCVLTKAKVNLQIYECAYIICPINKVFVLNPFSQTNVNDVKMFFVFVWLILSVTQFVKVNK